MAEKHENKEVDGRVVLVRPDVFNSFLEVDSFKRSSKIKSHPEFEVNFPPFYAQKERKLSEFNLANMVRGIRFRPRFKFSEFHDTEECKFGVYL